MAKLDTPTQANFLKFTNATPYVVDMLFADSADGTTGTIDLDKMITISSNIAGCSEYTLTSYTDETKST
jgi:hypothetical protein